MAEAVRMVIADSLARLDASADTDAILEDALERLGSKSIPAKQTDFHAFASGALYDAVSDHLGGDAADAMMGDVRRIWQAVNLVGETQEDEIRSVRVLLVDDDALALKALARTLREAGADVVTAHDAPSALKLARDKRPDVIVADYDMPGESGATLATMVALTWGDVAPPVICLTGVFPPPKSEAFQLVLTKPVHPQRFITAISEAYRQGKADIFVPPLNGH
jgi:CheY-like chemotaxis protein